MLRNLNQSSSGRRILGTPKVGLPAAALPTGFAYPGLLENDVSGSDPAGCLYRVRITSWPSAGTLTVFEDGSFTFAGAPDGTYSGTQEVRKYDPASGRISSDATTYSITLGSAQALVGVPGSVALTSSAGALAQTQNLSGAPGTVPGLGSTAALTQVQLLTGAPGTVPLVGATGALPVQGNLQAAPGTISLAGSDGTLAQVQHLGGAASSVALSGTVAALMQVQTRTGAAGTLPLAGNTGALTEGQPPEDFMPDPSRTLAIGIDESIARPRVFVKAAYELLDYTFDWSRRLAATGDSIVSYSIEAPGPIEESNLSRDGMLITVWEAGGTPPTRDLITCRITTLQGRQYARSFYLEVVEAR